MIEFRNINFEARIDRKVKLAQGEKKDQKLVEKEREEKVWKKKISKQEEEKNKDAPKMKGRKKQVKKYK